MTFRFELRRWAVLGLISAALLSGCGGSEDQGPAQTVTVTDSTNTEAMTPNDRERASAKPTSPKPPSRADRAEAVVSRYYAAVDSGSYRKAWALVSPALRSELGGYGSWSDGYANTLTTKVSDVRATDVSPASVTVALKLAATDVDACGDRVDQTFAGTWTLTSVAGDLLGSEFNVDKVSGGTPVTDASSCGGGGGAPVPVGPAGCDPNYTGCVPPYPPDVDCIQVRQEVDVIGEDVHHLGSGGDGEACELFFR